MALNLVDVSKTITVDVDDVQGLELKTTAVLIRMKSNANVYEVEINQGERPEQTRNRIKATLEAASRTA